MTRWTSDNLVGKTVTVVGLGKSGLASARFCRAAGATVTVSEAGQADGFAEAIGHLEPIGVALEFGPHRPKTFEKADLIILSPGVPHTIAPLEAARRRGIPVIGEMELAARFIAEPIVAVTGTNGKTTTTELLGAMLQASGLDVFVGGNIGTPLIEYVESGRTADWLVVEVSSFQLDTMDRFHPRIGCLLNISEDHLDRYPDYTAYAAAKWGLFRNQTAEDTAVINGALSDAGTLTQSLPGQTLFFNGAPDGRQASARIHGDRLNLDFGNGSERFSRQAPPCVFCTGGAGRPLLRRFQGHQRGCCCTRSGQLSSTHSANHGRPRQGRKLSRSGRTSGTKSPPADRHGRSCDNHHQRAAAYRTDPVRGRHGRRGPIGVPHRSRRAGGPLVPGLFQL